MAKRPYDSAHWRNHVRPGIIKRDGGLCQIRSALCETTADSVHHIISWQHGGPWYSPANLIAACTPCNSYLNHNPTPPDPNPPERW